MDITPVSPSQFDLLQEEWNALLHRSPSDNVFLRWEWIHTWWKHFGAGRTLALLSVREGGRLVGIAPFYVDRPDRWGTVCLRLCSDELYPDGLDLIAEKGLEREVAGLVWRNLRQRTGGWDLARWEHLPEGASLSSDPALFGGALRVEDSATSPYLPITSDFDRFLETRHYLEGLHKKHKRLFARAGVTYEVVRGGEDLGARMEKGSTLHAKRSGEKGVVSNFVVDRVMGFHRELAGLFAREGILRLHFLREGSKPLAAKYCFNHGGKVYYYQAGFDPEWNKFSVGAVATGMMIRRAFEEGDSEFCFLKGEEAYKWFWTDLAKKERSFTVYAPSPRGVLWRAWESAREALRSAKRLWKPPTSRREAPLGAP